MLLAAVALMVDCIEFVIVSNHSQRFEAIHLAHSFYTNGGQPISNLLYSNLLEYRRTHLYVHVVHDARANERMLID